MKKLIFFDIDGTLISYDTEEIPAETLETVEKLKENGHLVAIASGRGENMTLPVMRRLGIDNAVLHNGGLIISHGEKIFQKKISKKTMKNLTSFLSKTDCSVFAFDGEYCYVHNIQPWAEDFMKRACERQDILKPLLQCENEIYAMTVYGDFDSGEQFQSCGDDFAYSYDQKEINVPGYTKGSGILHMAQLLGFEKSDIIAVGDGHNDIEMIKAAHVGIAVGRAVEPLKAAADMVTDDIENGGIKLAFEKLGLI